jgi:hypothetical protein
MFIYKILYFLLNSYFKKYFIKYDWCKIYPSVWNIWKRNYNDTI